MRISLATLLLLLIPLVTSRAIPVADIISGDVVAISVVNDVPEQLDLEKRRGGGGGGGKGGSGGSGGGSGGRTGSSGGSTGSSGSGGTRGGSGSSSSSTNGGGVTRTGSGSPRTYGSGSYYAGGASVPYTSGARSPLGITPFLFPIAGLALFSGWHYNAYAYPWSQPYHYANPTNGTNQSLPVICLCEQYSECGCDNNNNSTYLNSILGNNLTNSSVVQIGNVNGTRTVLLNGTLANGTTAADPSLSAAAPAVEIMRWSGYCVLVAIVSTATWLL